MIEQSTDELFTLERVHRAPADLVFACLTTPEHLTHFWGPTGSTTPLEMITVDLRVGGRFETTMVSDADGSVHTMRAAYTSVEPHHLVAWRERDSGVLTEIALTELDDGTTRVVTTQRGLPPPMRTPQARAGWATALDRFAAYVASRADAVR